MSCSCFRSGELQMANEISQDVYRSLEEKLSGLSNKTIIGPTGCLETLRQIPFQRQGIIAPAANQDWKQPLDNVPYWTRSSHFAWDGWLVSELMRNPSMPVLHGGVMGICNQDQLVPLDAGHLNCIPHAYRPSAFAHSVNSSNLKTSWSDQQNKIFFFQK